MWAECEPAVTGTGGHLGSKKVLARREETHLGNLCKPGPSIRLRRWGSRTAKAETRVAGLSTPLARVQDNDHPHNAEIKWLPTLEENVFSLHSPFYPGRRILLLSGPSLPQKLLVQSPWLTQPFWKGPCPFPVPFSALPSTQELSQHAPWASASPSLLH